MMAGKTGSVSIKQEYADELTALAPLVDAGLIVMQHEPDWCACEGTAVLTAACVRLTMVEAGSATQ